MAFLIIAVAAFSVVHLIPAVPAFKKDLADQLGRAYGPLFGIASFLTLLLIVMAWTNTDRVAVYAPPDNGYLITYVCVLVAFVFVGITIFRGRVRQAVRLPLAIAVIFWGTGHLFANGDNASIALFGGFIAYGLAHLIIGFANGYRPSAEVRSGHDLLSVITGLALYAAMAMMHEILIGVPVFQLS